MANLALRQDSSCFLADLVKGSAAVRPVQQGPFDFGFLVDIRQPVGLGDGGRCPAQEDQAGAECLGQGDRDFGGHTACASADNDQVAALYTDRPMIWQAALGHRLELDYQRTFRSQGDFGGTTVEQFVHDRVGGAR